MTTTTIENSATTRRIGVSFDDDRNTIHILGDHLSQDHWVSLDDFNETKKRMKRKVQEWKMKGYGVLLRDIYDNPHPAVQRNINAVSLLDERDCIRGMERSISSSLDQKVASSKHRCVRTVLSHQRLMKKQNDVTLSSDEMREELAIVAKMQSRACALLARRLGKADELAVKEEKNDEKATADAHRLVEHLNTMNERQKPRTMGLITSAAGLNTGKGRSHRAARIA